jgi:hypothetical protein
LAWRVEVTPAAAKELRKLDRQVAMCIGAYLQELVTAKGAGLSRSAVTTGGTGRASQRGLPVSAYLPIVKTSLGDSAVLKAQLPVDHA